MSALRTAQRIRSQASSLPASSRRMFGSKDTSAPLPRAISTARRQAPRISGVSSSSMPGKWIAKADAMYSPSRSAAQRVLPTEFLR